MKKILTLITVLLLGHSGAFATSITLDPGLLPSSQGWDYEAAGLHAGTAETDIFSTDGTVLTMNTMGQSLSGTGGNILYRRYDVVSPAPLSILEWTSRTLEYEPSSGPASGFTAGFADGSLRYRVNISLDKVILDDGAGSQYISIDATEYHTYRIETVADTLTYNFYIDDVLRESASARFISNPNVVFFGDGTSTANARVDITSLEFSQIPEPSSAMLILFISGSGLFIRRMFPAV